MPRLTESRASESRSPATRPPMPSRPAEGWIDLRRPSRGNSGGRRRCRVRARSWAVRGTHDSFEGRRNHTCSVILAVVLNTTRGSSLAPRRETVSTCEHTWAGRAYEGRGETTGRRVRCFSTRAPRLTLTRACRAWRVEHGASGRRRLACPGYVSKLAPQEETQRTMCYGHHGHHGHP